MNADATNDHDARRSARSATSGPATSGPLRAALMAAAAALLLAGCGVRGNLEPPPGAKAAGQATRPDASDAAGSSAKPQQHQGFILDRLIR